MHIVHQLSFAITLLISNSLFTAAREPFILPTAPAHIRQIPRYCSAIMDKAQWEVCQFITSPPTEDESPADPLLCCHNYTLLPVPPTFNYQIVHALNVLSSPRLCITNFMQYGAELAHSCLYVAQAEKLLSSRFEEAYEECIATLQKNWLLVDPDEYDEAYLVFKKEVSLKTLITDPILGKTFSEQSLMRHLLTFFDLGEIRCFVPKQTSYLFLAIHKTQLEAFQSCFNFQLPLSQKKVRFSSIVANIPPSKYVFDTEWIEQTASRFVNYAHTHGEIPSDVYFDNSGRMLIGRSIKAIPFLASARYKKPHERMLNIYRTTLAQSCTDLYMKKFDDVTDQTALLATCQQAIDCAIDVISRKEAR